MNDVEVLALQANIWQLMSGIPITPTQELYFNSYEERDAWFSGKVIYTFTDMKYIREHRALKVNLNVETLKAANYMRFRNTAYNGAWMYCFIDAVEYLNPNTALIHFHLDAWQTYFANIEIRDCDIAREHEDSGAAYNANTQPEGIDYGSHMIINQSVNSFELVSGVTNYIIVSTMNLINSGGTADEPIIYAGTMGRVNGMPTGCDFYYVDGSTSDISEIFSALSDYPWVAQSIISVFPFPSSLIPKGMVVESAMGFRIGYANSQGRYQASYIISGWMSSFPSYEQRKLYCYPYSYIEVSMSDGTSLILQPECIDGNNIEMTLYGVINPLGELLLRVNNYNGSENEQDFNANAIGYSGFPSFPVQNNQYIVAKQQAISSNNLTRQQAQDSITVNGLLNVANTVAGLFGSAYNSNDGSYVTGGLSGAVGLATGLVSDLYGEHQAAQAARQQIQQMTGTVSLAGGTSGGTECITIANSNYQSMNITVRWYSLRPEYREKLQQYFDAFGYASNRVGVPNMNNRSRYNYVRCNSVNIYGDVPQEHLAVIRNMFLNGVTFWHDWDNVGEYGNNT